MKDTLHIYTRVSTGVQTKGHSLEDQKETGIRVSKQHKMKHRIWNEGGKTSKLDTIESRVVLHDLFKEVSKGKVKHLFFWDLTRGMRTDFVRYYIKSECIKHKVTLYTSNGIFDFSSPQDKLFYDMVSSFGIYGNELSREKSILGKISGMKKGHWKGGDINFGYKLVDKKLQIEKTESIHVKKIYEMYEKGKSTKDLQNYLLSEGIKTRRNNSVFPLQSITNILKNTIYIGYKDMRITDFHYRFECPSIVDESLFHKVQMRMKDILERKNQINRTKNKYLLREYLYCNCCKNGMSGRITNQGHSYYFCSNRTRLWKRYKNGKEKCRMNRSINIKLTDFMVWETICDLLENSVQLKEDFKSKSLETKFKSDKDVKNEVRRIRGRISRISREINGMNENLLLIEKEKWTNKMEEKTYNEVKTSILKEIEKLEGERDSKELSIKDTLIQKNWLNWINRYSKKIEKLRETKNIEEKKETLGEVLNKIYVDWDRKSKEHILDIRLKLPLFNDKLKYKDIKSKSKGYELVDGSNQTQIRYKNKRYIDEFIDEVKKKDNLNVQTKTIGDG
jgi:DNA invertase Pin-like site-specific DNA recombinase